MRHGEQPACLRSSIFRHEKGHPPKRAPSAHDSPHGQKGPTDLKCTRQQNGGHNEKDDLSSCTSSNINRGLRGLVRSSRATDGFAITKPIGHPADRLHLCWSLPLGSHLGLHSKKMCMCALRC